MEEVKPENISQWIKWKNTLELSGISHSISYEWADGVYMAEVNINYPSGSEWEFIVDELRKKGYDKTVYFFDSKLNLISSTKFDSVISARYINNTFYCILEGGGVFCSKDMKNWTESSWKDLMEQPVYNNGVNYIRNTVTGNSINKISVSSDNTNWKPVIFEGETFKECFLAGDYYMAEGDDSLYFSEDGVYWSSLKLPYRGNKPFMYLHNYGFNVFNTKDFLLVDTFDWSFYYSMKDISAFIKSLSSKDRAYVEFNGEMLGFKTPALMRNGEVLVPLNFTFEKMGAKVVWNESMQSAAITYGDKTVTITMEDAKAKVNGKLNT